MSKAQVVDIKTRYKDKKTNKMQSIFDLIPKEYIYILRADNPDKPLSEKASRLTKKYYDMINQASNGVIFVKHKFISDITYVNISQNKRLHNQLRELFDIQYHKSVVVKGRVRREGFTVKFTKNAEEIFEDPKLFYGAKTTENDHLTVLKRTVNRPKKDASISNKNYIEKQYRSRSTETVSETEQKTSPEFESLKSNSSEKTLKDFYPVNAEDWIQLQILSGRDFSLNATNEILLDMSNRLNDKRFRSKKGFMSYFSTCLRYEKRDAVRVNNETFKIKANMTEEDKHADKMYKYLEKVESSLEVSPELNFKKKICALPNEKAYELLTAYQSLVVKDKVAKLYLYRPVELYPMQFETVLNQIQASHPAYEVEKLEIIPLTQKTSQPQEPETETEMTNNNVDAVIIQKFGADKGKDLIANHSIKELQNGVVQVQSKFGETLDEGDKHLLKICIKEAFGDEIAIVAAKEKFSQSNANDLWNQFRKFAHSTHYKTPRDASAIFSAWFEKLKPTQNTADNKLILSGESFIIQHIDSNYSELIEDASKQLKINIELISDRSYDKPILYKAGVGKFERMSEERLNELMKTPFAI